ncbi:hypothetical protein C7S18_08650 [Ahniella affigens]|uniref:ATP-binding protein n=1 Tax=Ahniella affigens TaxID=2021234 RepID=A0A2P1PR16_9GAMM|nr:hypothetical protein C7S18_08650 [Ahniella affigens]
MPLSRPDAFTMSIQGGMLEALGINMYTTLGKCLVEFVANAYDAESPIVEITVPVEDIAVARKRVRDSAKSASESDTDPAGNDVAHHRSRVLLMALPEAIKVTIRDKGHGMTPAQIEQIFLPINRKRRLDAAGLETNVRTETSKRYAMGRKGLGKLAGFGSAECVTIETKRAGQDFATRFEMHFAKLAKATNLTATQLPAQYIDGLPPSLQYTQVELSGLKCDAVRNNVDSIRNTIAEAFFGIPATEFDIRLNGEPVELPAADYEFIHPVGGDAEGFSTATVSIDLMAPLEFKYQVKFRRMGSHLPAAKRGARIYCNGRLAAGPTLLDLPTGMHNFHAQSYMECIVVADDLDRFGVDIINTNRTNLRQDSELVEKFLGLITEIMKAAIAAHSKFRDKQAETEIDSNPNSQMLSKIAAQLPSRTRSATKKLITTMAARHGVDSEEFRTIVPLVLNAANATEVLLRLSELGTHPETIGRVAKELRELAAIEKSDALKLYRARRDGIRALIALEIEGAEHWRKIGSEKQLHELFKAQPWLVRPEWIRPIVSDMDMSKVVSKIAQCLSIDCHADVSSSIQDLKRPDLVFLLGTGTDPRNVVVVELKSPSLPLAYEHLEQLKSYLSKVNDFLETEYPGKPVSVTGILIGAMPDSNSRAEGSKRLLREIKKRGPSEEWEVIGLIDLIERARAIHLGAIEALERDERDDEQVTPGTDAT